MFLLRLRSKKLSRYNYITPIFMMIIGLEKSGSCFVVRAGLRGVFIAGSGNTGPQPCGCSNRSCSVVHFILASRIVYIFWRFEPSRIRLVEINFYKSCIINVNLNGIMERTLIFKSNMSPISSLRRRSSCYNIQRAEERDRRKSSKFECTWIILQL